MLSNNPSCTVFDVAGRVEPGKTVSLETDYPGDEFIPLRVNTMANGINDKGLLVIIGLAFYGTEQERAAELHLDPRFEEVGPGSVLGVGTMTFLE